MNILILNWKDVKNPEAGGAEVIAFEFASRLVKDGHTVTVFCRQYVGGEHREIIDGVRVIREGNRYSVYFRAYLYYLSLQKKPDKVIDMVNTLCWMTPLYVPRKKRILYVNQLAKEVLFYELSKPYSYIAYFLERIEYLPYRSTKTICYSQSTRKDLISFGLSPDLISVFPLGIDHNRYFPLGKKALYPLFIFVARLVRMKRADLCIIAMKYVVKKYKNAKLIILGNGPDELNLMMLIKKQKMSKHIEIIGKNNFYLKKTTRDLKVKWMQKAWAIILPSVKEGWGMVVTEAASCKTPAIVTSVTGLVDSVVDQKTGIVISKNPSPRELADSMMSLVDDSEKREKYSEAARKRSLAFTWNKSYKEFIKILL